MRKASLAAIAALVLTASSAAAQPGASHAVALKMKRGTDALVVHGVLRRNVDCCAYSFKAEAGQKLYWTETGAAARIGIAYPDGDGVDPGLQSPADLPQSGTYTLLVSPDLMAEAAFGPFTLKLRIPPPR